MSTWRAFSNSRCEAAFKASVGPVASHNKVAQRSGCGARRSAAWKYSGRQGRLHVGATSTAFSSPRWRDCSIENGHINYQHPTTAGRFFDRTLDRFSALVIYLSLIALEREPELWQKYHDENLIFKRADFEAPGQSALWGDIKRLDGECRRLTEVLERACLGSPPARPYLLDLVSSRAKGSLSSVGHLGAVAVLTAKPVSPGPLPPQLAIPGAMPRSLLRRSFVRAGAADTGGRVVALHMFCAWMAIAAALASFVPLFQPWILGAGVSSSPVAGPCWLDGGSQGGLPPPGG